MRILGVKPDHYGREAEAYIVEITVNEMKKVANKAGYRDDDQMARLKVGDEHPISEGFDFHQEILRATRSMQAAYVDFVKAAPTMHRFVGLISMAEEAKPTQEPAA